MDPKTVAVLLPTKGRYEALTRSLFSLVETVNADCLEIVVVADCDAESHEIATRFSRKNEFADFKTILSCSRLYPVPAFLRALSYCESYYITFMNDENTYDPLWLDMALFNFDRFFPDGVGVLSLFKKKKAGLGITTRDFIEYNEGELFHDGYRVAYNDDELTCRAILLGRYAWLENSGIFHDTEITNSIPIIPPKEKIKMKKADRGLFYKRSEANFYLPKEKLYEWPGFVSPVIRLLKGGSDCGSS